MHLPRCFQALAMSLALACLPAIAAAATSAIAFSQPAFDGNGVATRSNLLLDEADSVRVLTPQLAGTLDSLPSWSPDGSRVVFQRTLAGTYEGNRTHLYSVARQGGPLRPLTLGIGNFLSPAWGPDGRIAYVTRRTRRDCLSVMGPDGQRPRNLACIDAPSRFARPVWSADGQALLVVAGAHVGRVEPLWRGLAFRVDASTGAATRLADVTLDEERQLEFSPDGRRGVFTDAVPNALTLIDFAAGAIRTVGWGYAPRWSRDGRRIAFTGETFDTLDGFRYYNPLFVMDADGRNLRQLTSTRVDNIAYFAADWSRDGTRILATRRSFRDPSLMVPSHALRIIDVRTGAILARPAGYAAAGAWFDQ